VKWTFKKNCSAIFLFVVGWNNGICSRWTRLASESLMMMGQQLIKLVLFLFHFTAVKGSAYRCLKTPTDPIIRYENMIDKEIGNLEEILLFDLCWLTLTSCLSHSSIAANEVNINLNDIIENLPTDLWIWIDPGVSIFQPTYNIINHDFSRRNPFAEGVLCCYSPILTFVRVPYYRRWATESEMVAKWKFCGRGMVTTFGSRYSMLRIFWMMRSLVTLVSLELDIRFDV